MNKQIKRFIALGLTISLASVPTLSEVSKANEVSTIQDISFLSTEINAAMQSVEMDKLLIEEYALATLEQPDIEELQVIDDLPKHQQTMREDAEDYLKEIKPELIDLNERSILVAEYMSLYNDFFVSEIEKVQEKTSSEQEARQNVEAGLQDLNFIIEEEQAEITDTQKEIEEFLINLEEDYEAFEAGVSEAEEYVIEQEGDIDETADRIEKLSDQMSKADKKATVGVMGGIALTAFVFFRIRGIGNPAFKAIVNTTPKKVGYTLGVLTGTGGTSFLFYYGIENLIEYKALSDEIIELRESMNGLESELDSIKMVQHQANLLVETTENVTTSLDNLSNKWNRLQSNTQTMANVLKSEDLNNVKTQFEESSVAWENTQNISEVYSQLEENTSAPVEIDLDGIDTEEEYEEALKEAHDVDEAIDISELTEEELEELLRDLMEEELDEAA